MLTCFYIFLRYKQADNSSDRKRYVDISHINTKYVASPLHVYLQTGTR